jgi:hypothetical protein
MAGVGDLCRVLWMVAQFRYSMAGRSRGRVTLYVVCTGHVEMRSTGFLVKPQNQDQWFVSGLASKSLGLFLRFGIKIDGDGFLVEPQNQGGGLFPDLGLKTGSYGLVIRASKSSRQFLGLDLKTTEASVCWLRHKTNRGRSAQDTRRDLPACFMRKQVGLGFPV